MNKHLPTLLSCNCNTLLLVHSLRIIDVHALDGLVQGQHVLGVDFSHVVVSQPFRHYLDGVLVAGLQDALY